MIVVAHLTLIWPRREKQSVWNCLSVDVNAALVVMLNKLRVRIQRGEVTTEGAVVVEVHDGQTGETLLSLITSFRCLMPRCARLRFGQSEKIWTRRCPRQMAESQWGQRSQ